MRQTLCAYQLFSGVFRLELRYAHPACRLDHAGALEAAIVRSANGKPAENAGKAHAICQSHLGEFLPISYYRPTSVFGPRIAALLECLELGFLSAV